MQLSEGWHLNKLIYKSYFKFDKVQAMYGISNNRYSFSYPAFWLFNIYSTMTLFISYNSTIVLFIDYKVGTTYQVDLNLKKILWNFCLKMVKILNVLLFIITDNVHNETNCSLGQYVHIRREIMEALVDFHNNWIH